VARAPLIRPTDAPPQAHAREPVRARTPDAGPSEAPARSELPRHVAIIMDGNRRWARARGASELEGHAAGVEAIRGLLRHAVRRGIAVLTLYAFSRENWARTDAEVAGLFALLEDAIRSETAELREQGVRVRLLGRVDELPPDTRRSIEAALAATADGHRLLLNIAFNYAGRTELVDAIRDIVRSGRRRRGALHRRAARPGSRHPDRRRAASVQLPHLAVRLCRARERRHVVARVRAGRPRCGARRVRQPHAALRALSGAQPDDAS